MKSDKIRSYLNLTATTMLGTIGALTGNIVLQAVAFFPAVVYQISSDLANRFPNDGAINNELIRPEYLGVEELDFPKAHLAICPFTETERKKWLGKYERFYQVPSALKKTLICGNTPILDGIVDSPLTLYMIVARNVHISNNSNLWYIYHEIFAEEVYKRDYEKGAPHAINTYRELLYRLTAEIANAVSREQHLSITVDKLLDIKQIRNLLDQLGGKEQNIQNIL